ncbi:MAG: hypothetical protein IJU76_05195 [Desulfovibrionaceae bacterium]|nr:hypothetical protein [Desulfovibrionaceae bacterium]
MLRSTILRTVLFSAGCIAIILFQGCKAVVPKLDPMKAEAPVYTAYTDALSDLNLVLETYLPPDYPETYFYVKPVKDATGLSATGEIPVDITALVRDAVSQVYYKVRHVERYDETDVVQIQAELLKLQTQKLQGIAAKPAERPAIDYTIVGRISQFDRNLESTSDKARAMANFGQGLSRTDISASAESASRLSRLAVSFSVFNPSGVSLPGKFGASMEVQYAKNGMDIGFAIFGNGLGFGAEATAMHGRHLALQMMTEFSVVQIIGRALNVPYWRVGASRKIFTPDKMVLEDWRNQYASMGPLLIAYMQSQCIANGDTSVMVSGQLDSATQTALTNFASKYGVKNRSLPNFELFRALEEHRLLDRSTAKAAWAAYAAYKGGARPTPVAIPQSRPSSPAPAKRQAQQPHQPQPRRHAPEAPRTRKAPDDVTKPLQQLLP